MRKNKKTPPVSEKRKLITKNEPKSPISEQYRTIRTNILFSSVDEELRTIMVTSSNPSEGKSTTVSNLAIVFANQGKKVLMVDADMRKPTVHYTFGLPNAMGLTNILTRQGSIKDALCSTDIDNLTIIPSGPVPPNPAELLGSFSMKEFLAEAKQQFDYIFFDTPPVLAVTDAQILANQCDGTVLVLNSGNTDIEGAQKTKELLASSQAKLIGAVLNNRSVKETNYYYYGT